MLTLLLLAASLTQPVAEDIPACVRATIDRVATDCEYIDTLRLGSGASLLKWRIAHPPDSNRALSDGARVSREVIGVHLIDCITAEGAAQYLAARLAEVGKDAGVLALGDEAALRQRGGDDSRTVIDFRVAQYTVSVTAPNGTPARLFAQATAAALRTTPNCVRQ